MRPMCRLLAPAFVAVVALNSPMISAASLATNPPNAQLDRNVADWGDAPDPSFPTMYASDGAHHWLVNNLMLGATVDGEGDGQPDATATGDDNDGTNDDDGVIFHGTLVPGQQTLMTVTVSEACAISAWIDFNGDGDWLDQAETLFAGIPLTSGAHPINLGVPAFAQPGNTYIRFRVTTSGALSPTGEALDGEVEDYMVTIEAPPEFDFGDAPDPFFPTLLGSNGARHVIDGVTFLGTLPDSEADGQPNSTATGDDLSNGDEDGVTFVSPLIPGLTALVDITASVPGMLDAWVDFNNNGSWADAGDQIFVAVPLSPGINTLGFYVPPGTPSDTVFTRFRFSSNGGLSFTGSAADGEVEDYQVMIGEPLEDWGDAPDPFYPTLLTNNGAVHSVVETVYLGSAMPDGETDGQPHSTANGDDDDGYDDEDGVVHSPGTIVPNMTSHLTVTVSTSGYLNAWVDFNADGDWTDAGEHVFNDTPVVAGPNSLTFTTPAGSMTPTCARYRFDTAGGLTEIGPAADGEVEDYFFATPLFVDGFESGSPSEWSSAIGLPP